MQFTDRLTLDGTLRRTAQGAVVSARVARAGNVQVYLGSELGVTDKATVRVYRPAAEVFKRDAIASYAGVPITIGHPAGKVDPANWRDLAVGETGEDVLRDGEFVRVPMMLRDAAAIAAVESGKRELSMGYDATVTMADGVTPDGEPFDAIMSDFKMNHVAIVDRARGGQELRIGDGADKWGASPVTPADERKSPMADLRKVLVDGLQVETTDAGAQAIDKLQKALADSAANITKLQDEHAKTLATKDEEIGKLKADLKTAQDAAKIDVDKLVADRAALVETVKAIDAKIETAGKSDADLRKAAVAAKLGDDMVKDASEAEILGMFKAVAKDAKADPVADAIRTGIKPTVTDARAQAEKALADSVTDLNAWRYQKEA